MADERISINLEDCRRAVEKTIAARYDGIDYEASVNENAALAVDEDGRLMVAVGAKIQCRSIEYPGGSSDGSSAIVDETAYCVYYVLTDYIQGSVGK